MKNMVDHTKQKKRALAKQFIQGVYLFDAYNVVIFGQETVHDDQFLTAVCKNESSKS